MARTGRMIGGGLLFLILLGVAVLVVVQTRQGDDGTDAPIAIDPAVTIQYPPDGTIIYAEALRVSGKIRNPPAEFTVSVMDVDGEEVFNTPVQTDTETWQVEVAHGYTGDPTEATVRVMAPEDGGQVYARSSVVLSHLSQRPEGIYGSITLPASGAALGGDSIPVEGRASGTDSVTLALVAKDGTAIDTVDHTVLNPHRLDEVPWRAQVQPGDTTGPATLCVIFTPPDAENPVQESVDVTLGDAAG